MVPLRLLIQAVLSGRLGWPNRATPATFSLPCECLTFSTQDGIRLSGWLIPHPQPRGLILLCHGIFSTRRSLLGQAAWLHQCGYACMLFDFRGRGQSQGENCSLGVHEPLDVLAALDFLQQRPDLGSLPLGALAQSLGAASLLTALEHDRHIQAVCLEACFASLPEAIWRRCQVLCGPLAGRVFPWVVDHLRHQWQLDVERVAPVQRIGQIGRPLLLIHDQLDWSLSRATSQRLYHHAAQPKTLWVAPWSLHCRAFRMATRTYQSQVGAFFEQHLNPR